MADIVLFIIQNIQQNAANQDIIRDLQAAGYDNQVITEAFAEAYAELGLSAADQALEQLVREQLPDESGPVPGWSEKNSKLLGYGIMIVAGLILVLVTGYLTSQISGTLPSLPEQVQELDDALPSTNESIQVNAEPGLESEIIVPNMPSLRIPILIELAYDNSGYTYQKACQTVTDNVAKEQLVSCLHTDEYYKFVIQTQSGKYCSDSHGNFGAVYRNATTDNQDCLGKSFSSPPAALETSESDAWSDEDRLYRALDFTDTRIELEEPGWLFNKTLCLGEPLNVNWYASLDISDVVVGVYQPGFASPEIKTIGSFPTTNNPQRIPGFGTYFWVVGGVRDGSVLLPGTGYRLVVRDADGQTKVESHSFSLSNCQ